MGTKFLIQAVKSSHEMTPVAIRSIILFAAVTVKHTATNVKRSLMELLPMKAGNVPDPSDHTRFYLILAERITIEIFWQTTR
jgi:hypothetical protein